MNKLPPSYLKSRLYNTLFFLGICYVATYFYFAEISHINAKQKQLQDFNNKSENPDNTIIKYSII
jgi:hypothetical protein